jgi:hypothetical protein
MTQDEVMDQAYEVAAQALYGERGEPSRGWYLDSRKIVGALGKAGLLRGDDNYILKLAADAEAQLANEAMDQLDRLQAMLAKVRVHLNYIQQPTMGLPAFRDAAEFAVNGATEQAARYALQLCIQNARLALAAMDSLETEL